VREWEALIMYDHHKLGKCDPENPYRPAYSGTFEIMVPVGGKERRMLAYAPCDIRESTAGLIVIGANGQTADELLTESGWCEIADQEECKEKLIVFFLEAENGIWNTDESYGVADGDVEYINQAALKAAERWYFCVHESKVYLTGVREGGVMAHMAAAANPAFYAGVATVGGSAVSEKYLMDAGKDYCTMLDGYEDPEHRKGIRKKDIPMPVYVIDDPECQTGTDNGVVKYWCEVDGTDPDPVSLDPDRIEYRRSRIVPMYPNQEKEAYKVDYSVIPGASKNCAKRLHRKIWKDFLYHQRRWMSCPGGDLRVTKDPVRDLHMEYHYEKFDGWMREWYIYVPESVRKKPDRKVPLVFAMHGYTCTGEIYAGNSGWSDVAERYGFIVIFPSALHGRVDMKPEGLDPDWASLPAWNVFDEEDRPDELRFFNYMLDRAIQELPVDPGRVYASGHSWGSLMTYMLALGMGSRLAAAAPCSGVMFGDAYERFMERPWVKNAAEPIPIWMFWGLEEEWLIPSVPTHENQTGKTLDYWMRHSGKEDRIPERWDSVPYVENGRFLDHKIEKQGTTPMWYTQVDYMPHATMPEMSFRIWEEFFSRFRRNNSGEIEERN
jgi:poly(3-hydroxybutyrate) depolymerase